MRTLQLVIPKSVIERQKLEPQRAGLYVMPARKSVQIITRKAA